MPSIGQSTIKAAIDRGLELLDKPDYEAFVIELTAPSTLRQALGSTPIGTFVQEQEKRGTFKRLRAQLMAARGLTPVLHKDDTYAVFSLPKSVEYPGQAFALTLIDGHWFLQ